MGTDRTSQRWVLATTIAGASMVFIDSTIVNVALPALQTDLGATLPELEWVIDAYALTLAALLLVGGALGDLYGRRRVFTIGVLAFGAASVACALAPTATTLIAARAALGVAGALLVPGSLALITAHFDEDQRGAAFGTWSACSAITTGLGPILGGWLITETSWRAAFAINIPLCIAVAVFATWKVPESKADERRPLDVAGALFAVLALCGVTFALIEAPRLGASHWAVVAAGVMGISSSVAFVITERRLPHAMVPPFLFRNRTFAGANMMTLLLYAALGAVFFFLPLNLIQVQGYSPAEAGAALLPVVIILSVVSRWTGSLVSKIGGRPLLTIGAALTSVGMLLMAVPDVGGTYFQTFFGGLCVFGLGLGFVVAPLTTVVMNAPPDHLSGVASGINNAVSRTGGLLAIAVFSAIALDRFCVALDADLATLDVPLSAKVALFEQRFSMAGATIPDGYGDHVKTLLSNSVHHAFVSAFRAVMYGSALLGFAGAITAWASVERAP